MRRQDENVQMRTRSDQMRPDRRQPKEKTENKMQTGRTRDAVHKLNKDSKSRQEERTARRLRKARNLLRRAGAMLAATALAAASLTGCHGTQGKEAFAVPEGLDESRQYEITFWAKNDTNKRQTAVYQQAIDDFEALYPNITVNIKLYTDYTKIYNDVITNMSTDTTPNVCITYPDHIATYMTGSNAVVALDELMEDPQYGLGGSKLRFDGPIKEEIIPQFLEECELQGACYAVPFMRSTEAVYVNEDMVEALGYELPDVLTWDFMFEVAEAAMEQNADGTYKVNGQNVLIPIIYKSTDNMMIQMLRQKGAGYSTEEGEIELFNDTTSELLNTIAQHAATGAFSTFKISSYPANFLNAGQCIFAIDSTAGATWMGTDAPLSDISEDAVQQFTTRVMMVPQYDTENPQMISQGPSICIFNKKDPQEVLASWLFAQFLLTNEIQLGYAETEGYVPVTSKAQESAEYQDYLSQSGTDEEHYSVKIDASRLLLENVEHTFTTAVFNGSASLRQAAGSLIESVTKSVRRHQIVDEAYLKELYEDTATMYKLDQITGSGAGTDADLGPLPAGAKALLAVLAIAWIGIGAAFCKRHITKK